MNERLKELANKAGCKIMDDGEWYIPSAAGLEKVVYTSGVGLEKFAELIVRECVDRVTTKANGWGDMTGFAIKESILDCAKDLKKHFGVEE